MYFLLFGANEKQYFLHDGRQTIIGSDNFVALEQYVAMNTHVAIAVNGFDTVNITRDELLSIIEDSSVMQFTNKRNFIYYGVEVKNVEKLKEFVEAVVL